MVLDFVLSIKHLNEQRQWKTTSNLLKLNLTQLKVPSPDLGMCKRSLFNLCILLVFRVLAMVILLKLTLFVSNKFTGAIYTTNIKVLKCTSPFSLI